MKARYSGMICLYILALLTLLPLSTYASSPSYDYISLNYVTEKDNSQVDYTAWSFDLNNTPFSGLALVGSIEVSPKWFTELRYLHLKGSQYTATTFTGPASSFGPSPTNASTGTVQDGFSPEFTQTSGSLGYQIFQDDKSSFFIALGLVHTILKIDYYGETIFRDSSGNIVTPNTPPGYWQPYSDSLSVTNNGKLISIGCRVNLSNQIQFGVSYNDALFDGFSSNNYAGEFIYKFTGNYSFQMGTELASNERHYSVGVRYAY